MTLNNLVVSVIVQLKIPKRTERSRLEKICRKLMWIVNLNSRRTTANTASPLMKSLTTAPMTGVITAVLIHMSSDDQSIFY